MWHYNAAPTRESTSHQIRIYRITTAFQTGRRIGISFAFAALAFTTTATANPPHVTKLLPAHGADGVSAATGEIIIEFDRDMNASMGMSICGGGETFPEIVNVEWRDARTFVAHVRLRPNQSYQMSLNCPASRRNFRSTDGEPLDATPWSFTTAEEKPLSATEQKALNEKAYQQLGRLIREEYSYHDLRNVDWKAISKKHRAAVIDATSTRDWVNRVATVLSEAKDVHIWLEDRGAITGTHQRNITLNFNLDGLKAALPNLQQRNPVIYSAMTDDNVGYLLIASLDKKHAANLNEVQTVLSEFKNCAGLIIDLRPNSGGDETLAMPIAAWFVEGETVYAKHAFREKGATGGFGPVTERKIRGNDAPNRFDGPVVVLTGPGIMSSAEAFVLMMKQGRRVTLLGEATYGSSGNPKPHTLANGVTVYLPSWKAMRPDGTTFEGIGISPDVAVKANPSELVSHDPLIAKARQHLKKSPT